MKFNLRRKETADEIKENAARELHNILIEADGRGKKRDYEKGAQKFCDWWWKNSYETRKEIFTKNLIWGRADWDYFLYLEALFQNNPDNERLHKIAPILDTWWTEAEENLKGKKKENFHPHEQAFMAFIGIFNQESALNTEGKIRSLVAWWRTWGDVIDNYDFREKYKIPLTLEKLIELRHHVIANFPEDKELLESIFHKLRLWHAGVLRPVTYWR